MIATQKRVLFTLTILAGSFLLFLVQPMIARMALPRLGGAPNVWNSAMLVYQALLLGGYAYAHAIGRLSLQRQGIVHLAVLLLAALSLPLALADLDAPAPGWEPLWVPWLFLLTVGPAFFAISAQAPLMQRWFAAHPDAGNPYPLYAASNLGSFGGLLAFPLLVEPFLGLATQSVLWSIGYGALVVLVFLTVLARRGVTVSQVSPDGAAADAGQSDARLDGKTIALWLALSAVPSGLMLSTTTFLTTDIMAMPLLWVIPLGLYLLSFSIAFAENRRLAGLILALAPFILLLDGGIAMYSAGRSNLLAALASIVLLFVVAVALHARMYETRPSPAHLTRFYLVMAAGGVLGGLFTALLAPLLFDWTWEHPLLILAAAALLPLRSWRGLLARFNTSPLMVNAVLAICLFITLTGSIWLYRESLDVAGSGMGRWLGFFGILAFAVVLAIRRWSFVLATAALLLGLGGITQLLTSIEGARERSYFGTYTVRNQAEGSRALLHGTTLHGVQRAAPNSLMPTSYYGEGSGAGLALASAERMFGPGARVGIVGLGVGTLACYRQPDQRWTFFEIDPVVHDMSTNGQFTFLRDCAPEDPVIIGDARLELEALPADSFDILVIDAFSSDAIPMHLLTLEAMDIYLRAMQKDGVLAMHISNRYINLMPVIANLAKARGLSVALRRDDGKGEELTPSNWVVFTNRPARLQEVTAVSEWEKLEPSVSAVWTDEYASILPFLKWRNFF